MYQLLSFILLVALSFSCKDPHPNPPLPPSPAPVEVSSEGTMSPVNGEYSLEPLLETSVGFARPSSVTLLGQIDYQYDIEATLVKGEKKDGITQLEGSYHYKNSDKIIPLTGRFFNRENKIILEHLEHGVVEECFQGLCTSSLKKSGGTWTKEKGEPLRFEFQNIEFTPAYKLFIAALDHLLTSYPKAALARSVGVDIDGVYIEDLEGLDLDYKFSPTSFESITYHHAADKKSSYKSFAYLHKLAKGNRYVAVGKYAYQGKPSSTGTGEEKTTEYQVWARINDQIVNIYVPRPAAAKYSLYAYRKGGQLLLVDTKNSQQEILRY